MTEHATPRDGSEPSTPSPAIDAVVLEAYDPGWPDRFEAIAAALRGLPGLGFARLEHIGSTAIPGMAAKPIIDVAAGVADHETARTVAVPALLGAGYFEVYWRFDSPPGHFQAVQRDPRTYRRVVHVHLAPPGHPVWDAVAFRDLLRSDPQEAERYLALKRELAARHRNDREAFGAAKAPYVDAVTRRALAAGYGVGDPR